MKLYTEEQVKQVIAFCNTSYFVTPADLLEDLKLTPIELPSDEEIEKTIIFKDIVATQGYCHCFIDGVNWMKEQILNKDDKTFKQKSKWIKYYKQDGTKYDF